LATDKDQKFFGDTLYYHFMISPAWLSIDSISGLISGVPRGINVGDILVRVKVSDRKGWTDLQTFTLTISHTNHSPVLISTPVLQATEDSIYRYQVLATDRDQELFGDRLYYHLTTRPDWLSIDTISGLIKGMPTGRDVGDTMVSVYVSDGMGGTEFQTFSILIHPNHAPVILSSPKTFAVEENEYLYIPKAFDKDVEYSRDSLNITFLIQPSWLKLVNDTLRGTPQYNNAGDTIVALKITNSDGTVICQTWKLSIIPVNHRPYDFILNKLSYPEGITFDSLKLSWYKSHDDDFEDTLTYSFHLWSDSLDMIVRDIADSFYVINYSLLKPSTHYFWTVSVSDGKFTTPSNDTIAFLISKSLVDMNYIVNQNYPNPFKESTTISYSIPEKSRVKIIVYNIWGQIISKVIDEMKSAGSYETPFVDQIATGLYFCRFEAVSELDPQKKYVRTIKMQCNNDETKKVR